MTNSAAGVVVQILHKQVQFLETRVGKVLIVVVTILALAKAFINPERFENITSYLPTLLVAIALLVILASFASRKSAKESWDNLIMPHLLIKSAIVINADHYIWTEVIMYGGGVLFAYLLGLFCLQKTNSVDKDISLNKYHGYVYEPKTTALLFLVATIGLIGFPLTTAFIGISWFEIFHYGDLPPGHPLLLQMFEYHQLAMQGKCIN